MGSLTWWPGSSKGPEAAPEAETEQRPLVSVLFEFIRTNDRGEEDVFYRIKLKNAGISGLKQHVDDGDRALLGFAAALRRRR